MKSRLSKNKAIGLKSSDMVKLRNVAILLFSFIAFMIIVNALSYSPSIDGTIFNLTEDEIFTYDLNATPDNNLNFTDDSNMFEIDRWTGLINFTPDNDDVGFHTVSLIVRNGSLGAVDFATIYLNVSNTNDPPNITYWFPNEFLVNTTENVSVGFLFNHTSSDPDIPYGDVVNATWVLDGVNVSYNDSWSYFPGFCDAGEHVIQLVVRDINGSNDTLTWNLTVTNVNRPIAFNRSIDNLTWSEDMNLTNNISLINYIYDPDYFECTGSNKDNLTWTVDGNNSVFIVINQTDSNVSFIPFPNWFGNETINFTVTDGYNTSTSNNIFLNVTPINDAPIFPTIINRTIAYNVSFHLEINVYDNDSSEIYFSDNSSMFNISKQNSTGALINFVPSFSDIGTHDIILWANDTEMIGNVTIRLIVINNAAPVLTFINGANATENNWFNMTVYATDSDGDNVTFYDNVTFFEVITTNKSGANAIGNISFLPTDANVGNWTIMINATDVWGKTVSQTFQLNITEINFPPTLSYIPNQTVKIGYLFQLLIASYASDPDLDSLLYSSDSTIFVPNYNTGLISVTVNNSQAGIYAVNISITDQQLNASQIVYFNVVNNTPPNITSYTPENLSQNITEPDSQIFSVNVTDVDGDNLTYTWYRNDTLLESGPWNSSWNFSGNFSTYGFYFVKITVSDGIDNATMNWTLFINNSNRGPYFNWTIQNITWAEDVNLTDQINLDDHFSDPDFNESINFSVWNNVNVTILINSSTHNVTFMPDQNWYGLEVIWFCMNDSWDYICSNNVTLNVTPVNDAPLLYEISNQTNLSVGQVHEIYLTSFDVDNDSMNFTADTTFFNVSTFENGTRGYILITPGSTMVGMNLINISVYDNGDTNLSAYQLVRFEVSGNNSYPNITGVYPIGLPAYNFVNFSMYNRYLLSDNKTYINGTENNTIFFNITTYDEDGDSLTYSWYVDGTLNNTASNFSWYMSFESNGTRNITVRIFDGKFNNTDEFSWIVNVSDLNRPSIFGAKTYSSQADFDQGNYNSTTDATNITGSLVLSHQNASDFVNWGNYLSDSIDLVETSPFVDFRNVSYTGNIPVGTNISIYTRTSPNGVNTWTNWSLVELNSSLRGDIDSNNSKFVQFQIVMTTINTSASPRIDSLSVEYGVPDKDDLDEDNTITGWIDLDNYFSDPDGEPLRYAVYDISESDNLGISIDGSTGEVTIDPTQDWYGVASFRFYVDDNNGTTSNSTIFSNEVTITVLDVEDETVQVPSSGGGGGSSSTRTVVVPQKVVENVTQPKYLKILVPDKLTQTDNSTLEGTINLKNEGDITLEGISLSAYTNDSRVELSYTVDSFASLAPNQIESTKLIVKTPVGGIEDFAINISAESENPVFRDSAMLYVNSFPLSSEINQTIKFVRDLLSNNPECLELNELLTESERAIDLGQYEKAKSLLDNVVEGCSYLISHQQVRTESPAQISVYMSFWEDNKIPLIIILISFIVLIFGTIIAKATSVRREMTEGKDYTKRNPLFTHKKFGIFRKK